MQFPDTTQRHDATCAWRSMDELRSAALANGCTPAQFEYTLDVLGEEPLDAIARFLQRHGFAPTLRAPGPQPASEKGAALPESLGEYSFRRRNTA